jgi:hypothetical protein
LTAQSAALKTRPSDHAAWAQGVAKVRRANFFSLFPVKGVYSYRATPRAQAYPVRSPRLAPRSGSLTSR